MANPERTEALELLHGYIKNRNMINHCLASEAVMSALAARLGEDRGKWALAGLLHDLDVEITNADMNIHGRESARILAEKGLDPEVVEAIRLHNEISAGEKRSKKLHHALAAGETITGMIIATTLVYPEKKLDVVRPASVEKRMKEKKFAASVSREKIMECELIGLALPEFIQISLDAMKSIHEEIGL